MRADDLPQRERDRMRWPHVTALATDAPDRFASA
jgi:hypothetical protein